MESVNIVRENFKLSVKESAVDLVFFAVFGASHRRRSTKSAGFSRKKRPQHLINRLILASPANDGHRDCE